MAKTLMPIFIDKNKTTTLFALSGLKYKFVPIAVYVEGSSYIVSWRAESCQLRYRVSDHLFIPLSHAAFLEAIRSFSVRSLDRRGCSWYSRHHQTTCRIRHVAWGCSRCFKWSWTEPYPKPCHWGLSSGGCTGTCTVLLFWLRV